MVARLFPIGVPILQVVDDYGAIGIGASQAHYVLAENGSEYIAKGPVLTPGHLFVAANELIAARLGGALALPILDHCILALDGHYYFGSSWMTTSSFFPTTTAIEFQQCMNQDRAYGIAVFDIFLCNGDRHGQNLLVRQNTKAGNPVRTLLMNDHSHCLVLPGEVASVLNGRVAAPAEAYVTLDFIRSHISDASRLREAVEAVLGLTNEDIMSATTSMPEEFLSTDDRLAYGSFLQRRRDILYDLVERSLAMFPNVKDVRL